MTNTPVSDTTLVHVLNNPQFEAALKRGIVTIDLSDIPRLSPPPSPQHVTIPIEREPRELTPSTPEEGQYSPTPPPQQQSTPPPEPQPSSPPSSPSSTPPPPLEPFTPIRVHTPIDYDRPDSPPNETDDPGAPFFPNTPGTPKYYPLQIPLPDGGSNPAKYIYYRKGFTEVVGTMGAGQPHYGEGVYLSSLRPNVSAPPFTAEQLQFFDPHDICACTLDETLIELNSPCITAEITRLRTGLLALKELDEKCEKLEDDARKLRSERLTVDLMLASTKRRLQYVGALTTIGNEYALVAISHTATPASPTNLITDVAITATVPTTSCATAPPDHSQLADIAKVKSINPINAYSVERAWWRK
ncbi:hypothetical protein H4582DRAFT_2083439 [Lactarius indigo]|nr:hypothetical protein H4582DRAFT_2083439 [Lactarius indigo]